MGSYIVTEQAEFDLVEIANYIAVDNLHAAIFLTRRFYELFQMLADNPRAGRERPELSVGLRGIPEGRYRFFYRIWAGNIAIVRVIHGARDLDEIFS